MSSQSGTSAHLPEAAQHIVGCERCRSVIGLLDEAGKALAPSEDQLKRIHIGILENLKPVRPLPSSWIFLFACAAIFLCAVAIGAMPFGMNGWGALNVAQRIAVFATLTASAVLLAISMVGQMVPGSKYALAPAELPITILTVLLLVIATTFRAQGEPAFVARGIACLKSGLTFSLPAGFLFWLLLRRGAILFPKLIGGAAGGLAGLIGLSVLEVNCPNLNVFHILVWHWGVVLVSSLAGVLIGAVGEYVERLRTEKMS